MVQVRDPGRAALAAGTTTPAFSNLLERIQSAIKSNEPSGFESTLRGVLGFAAPALASAVLPGFGTAFAVASTTAEQTQRSQQAMGLNLSGLLGGLGQAVSGINTSGYGNISNILGGGLQIAGAAFAPQPVAQPMYGPPAPVPQAYPVAARAPQIVGAVAGAALPSIVGGGMIVQAAKQILPKIAAALGRRNITLQGAVDLARKLGKFFISPESIALYMGITVAELATLITARGVTKRRRMNPANSKALRRAARRIKSFHRLCQHTDLIRTRRRGGTRCGTCRKTPCRC